MRIIFAGTTNFSAKYLDTLLHSSHQVIAVFTQTYFPNKYEKFIYEKNIQEIAHTHKLPIFQPKTLYTNNIINIIKHLKPDIIIVVSYGLIIPNTILYLPPLGCINVHGSLLPRWRGAAPIQRAIEHGDTQTGITIIQMNTGIDTGNILYKHTCNILPNETSLSLFQKLSNIGTMGLLQIITQLSTGKYISIPQDNTLATYAKKIKKTEGQINWDTPAIQLERQIRAFNPWPVSFFKKNGKRIKIWKAMVYNTKNTIKNIDPGTILSANQSNLIIATREGSLSLQKVQEEGKKIITTCELLNSKKHLFIPGSKLKYK